MNYFIAGVFTAIGFIALYIIILLMIESTGAKDATSLLKYIKNRITK